ncbi:MAG: DUF4124 domain-containing protein [Thiolinea sp.]
MKTPLSRLATLLLLGIGLSCTAQAEIFKWTDADGNTHYTQTPPPDQSIKAEDIAADIDMAAGTKGQGEEKKATPEPEQQPADTIEAARRAGASNQAKVHDFCEKQEATLKQLLANPVIRWQSSEGEKILTAKERAEKIASFEKNIKEVCNPEVLGKPEVGAQ